MNHTVLIVEDNDDLLMMLKLLLTQNEFNVITAQNYYDAIKEIDSAQFDLALLDWMIPGGDGIQLIHYLRNNPQTHSKPIIMLTAKQSETDQIKSLDIGADDYITKPFSQKNLLTRIKVQLRRLTTNNNKELQQGKLKVDLDAKRIYFANQELNLNLIEYKLLTFFMEKPDRVFSREQILLSIWGADSEIDDRTIDVNIGRLRKQLEPHHYNKTIETVRGIGYRFSLKSVNKE